MRTAAFSIGALAVFLGLSTACRVAPRAPSAPGTDLRAPDHFQVELDTSRGPVVLDVERGWAPHGADRFYTLVREHYYDQARFFRMVPGRWVQFGIAADPAVSAAWRDKTIPDDPNRQSNVLGTIAFAFAVPHGRTTQVYISLRDNSYEDKQGFAPFGKVIQGMDVVTSLYSGYGERAVGGIRAGRQEQAYAGGNAYLEKNFPKMDFIRRARIVR